MSTIRFGVIEPQTVGTRFIRSAFVKPFRDGPGVVFGIFSLPKAPEAEAFVAHVRHELETQASRSLPDPSVTESAFERIVQDVNESGPGTAVSSLPNIQGVVGIVGGKTLALAGFGNFRGTLLRQEKENTFHVFDLLRGLADHMPEPGKLFSALVTGDLEPGDIFGIALPETIAAIEEMEWKKTLATMPLGEARNHLARRLMDRGDDVVVLLCLPPTESLTVSPAHASVPALASIEALRRTEHATELLLKGGSHAGRWFLGVASNIFQTIKRLIDTRTDTARRSAPRTSRAGSDHPTPARSRTSVLKLIGRILTSIALFFVGLVSGLITIIRHPSRLIRRGPGRPHRLHDFREAGGRLRDVAINRFNGLPRLSKMLLIVVLVFVVLFSQSILYLRYRAGAEAKRDGYEAAVIAIERAKDEAEAMIIYRDEAAARALLLKTKDDIGALPQRSRSERRRAAELTQEIDSVLVGLRHEIPVEPTTVALLPADSPANAYNAALYQTENPLLAQATNLPGEAVDIKKFGDRLYALVPSVPQIYRLSRSGTGYGNPTTWVRDDAGVLADARSLAVDGAIYVLRPTEVVKFFTGSRESWEPYVDPPLVDATRIWTSDEVTSIYILDPASRRIVVLAKPGSLLAQYIFPEGVTLRDFAVDEKNQKLSVLTGDRIEEITLTHLVGQ